MINEFLEYLVQSSIIFTVLLLIYKVSVSRLTFHISNRIILLLLPLLSLILPMIEIPLVVDYNKVNLQVPLLDQTSFHPQILKHASNTVDRTTSLNKEWVDMIDVYGLLFIIYFVGLIITLIRILIPLIQILKLKRNSEPFNSHGYKVSLINGPSSFSFFNWIFVPLANKNSLRVEVLEHEAIHVKYRHTYDLLYLQIYTMIFWFNPILKLFRKSLKSVHEFQVDDRVIKNGTQPSVYLSLILADMEQKSMFHSLSYFNNLTIKKRIEMIEKSKSKKSSIARYSFLVIFVTAITLGFKEPEISTTEIAPKPEFKKIFKTEPPSIFPIKEYNSSSITSLFGQKARHPRTKVLEVHQGIDVEAPRLTPVLATSDGIVVKAKNEGDWGNLIILDHGNGYQSFYAHLENFNVSNNKAVKKGDVIGYLGNTGLSSGYHLHYEVRKDNIPLNPLDFF